MAEPATLATAVQQAFGGDVHRGEIDELLEQLGAHLDDPGLLARAMDTTDRLLATGLPAAAVAYVKTMLGDPDLLEDNIRKPCRCDRQFVSTGRRSVKPCPRCNRPQHERFCHNTDKPDYQLGGRNHLDHADNPKRCKVCRGHHQLGDDPDDPEQWR